MHLIQRKEQVCRGAPVPGDNLAGSPLDIASEDNILAGDLF